MTVIICIGMAGSGKTTFVQRLNSHLHAGKTPPYVLNLDPAVLQTPFGCNIDIRDSVNYKKVMKEYSLGPNGAIMTCLNLFSTKIDQVLGLVEKRAPTVSHVLVDTPGQIECFIWSASGAIITDALASSLPTVIAYIVDTPRTASPTTFMSNMLYACSILYKTKLPMILVFNKTDVKDASFAKTWVQDFEAFQSALSQDADLEGENEDGQGYMGSLLNSLSLVLEEFYRHLETVSCSAYTGEGFDDFLAAVKRKSNKYETDYKRERDEILKQRQDREDKRKAGELSKLVQDLDIDKSEPAATMSDYESDTSDERLNFDQDPDREYNLEAEVDEDS